MPTEDQSVAALETEDTPFYAIPPTDHRPIVFAPCTPSHPLRYERYRQAVTHIQCPTREALDAVCNGETSSRLASLLSESSLMVWKHLGFAQHLTLFYVPSATADDQPNVALSFVYTKNWTVSRYPLAVFHLANVGNSDPHYEAVVDQLMRQNQMCINIFCQYVYHHEHQCRVLKTQQQLKTEHASLADQIESVWRAVRLLQNTHETTQQNTENTLQQHASLLGQWHSSVGAPKDTMAWFKASLQQLQDDCEDMKDRQTAQARMTEMQQERICSALADREYADAAVLALEKKHSELQMTVHIDNEARADWTAHHNERVRWLETQLAEQDTIIQDIHRAIQQNQDDNRWLCIYLCFACVILYQCIVRLGL